MSWPCHSVDSCVVWQKIEGKHDRGLIVAHFRFPGRLGLNSLAVYRRALSKVYVRGMHETLQE